MYPRQHKVTALIPAFNSAALIRDVLEDVRWADEILVADSFSTDRTVEICQEFGAKVIQHEYINSAAQKNWAIPQCEHDWVLIVDTDERLPQALQDEVQELLNGPIPEGVHAFRVARQTMILGKWITSMNLWPDYQTRLFRKQCGRYEEKEVHADIAVPGEVRTLRNPLVHNSTLTLSKQIGLLDRYSDYQSKELQKQGYRFRWHNVLIRPIAVFLYLYLLKGGIREGFRGLFIAFHSMAFTFFTHAKLWEKEWRAKTRP